MGQRIVSLIHLFDDKIPDAAMHHDLVRLASNCDNWGNAHEMRSGVRRKLLSTNDSLLQGQCYFTEACLETLYNESQPDDPFDSVAPFWIVPSALGLARALGINMTVVVDVSIGSG